MEMNPKELVKALRRCANGESEDCPFAGYGVCGCPEMSADQIERDQKAIAELKAKVEQYRGAHPVVCDSDDAEGGQS